MTAALEIVQPALHTTVQDFGRFGYQALGVPVSGALDAVSLRLVNAVVGNDGTTAALELFYGGLTLAVAADSVRVAASAEIEVLGARSRVVPAWYSVRLERGEQLRVGATVAWCGYLAVGGGLALDPVLGSWSTTSRSALGGFEGRALRSGDLLPLVRDAADERPEVRLAEPPDLTPRERLRVVLGPQHQLFTTIAIEKFLSEPFQISADADRMGMRLAGPDLEHREGHDIVSDGIVTGAIQVPGSGQPILLLADHQTTGGYPKIATVMSADLPAVGRLRPRDRLCFEAVSVAAAEAAARHLEDDLCRRAANVVAASPSIDETALRGGNLISGVVSGVES